MRRLLEQPKFAGYPLDFMLARLRGQRRDLERHVEQGRAGERLGSWVDFLGDCRVIRNALPPAKRQVFAPCFLFFELRTLQMLLRDHAGRDRSFLERVSKKTMLDKVLLKRFEPGGDHEKILQDLEPWLGWLLPDDSSLLQLYAEGGNRKIESELVDGFLRRYSKKRQSPVVQFWLRGLIDQRNLLSAARALRWGRAEARLLDGGGGVSRQLIEGNRGRSALEAAVSRCGGEAGSDPALLEVELQADFGRQISRLGRDPLGQGLVLDYIWRRYTAFRQLGLHHWAGSELGAWEGVL